MCACLERSGAKKNEVIIVALEKVRRKVSDNREAYAHYGAKGLSLPLFLAYKISNGLFRKVKTLTT